MIQFLLGMITSYIILGIICFIGVNYKERNDCEFMDYILCWWLTPIVLLIRLIRRSIKR